MICQEVEAKAKAGWKLDERVDRLPELRNMVSFRAVHLLTRFVVCLAAKPLSFQSWAAALFCQAAAKAKAAANKSALHSTCHDSWPQQAPGT